MIADLSVNTLKDAIEKIVWYSLRSKIETFHKILKSGCKVEESKLRNADRLVKLISVFCIISWRIFWMTMINQLSPNSSPKVALNKLEIWILDHLIKDNFSKSLKKNHLSVYLQKIARLGGYLARTRDSPPGNIVMWRGISRLTDIELGYLIRKKTCG